MEFLEAPPSQLKPVGATLEKDQVIGLGHLRLHWRFMKWPASTV